MNSCSVKLLFLMFLIPLTEVCLGAKPTDLLKSQVPQALQSNSVSSNAVITPPPTLTSSLKDFGAGRPIHLTGTLDGQGIWFGIRNDESVRKIRLRLRYSFSPSLITNLSHLKILLNEEVIDTINLPKEQAGSEQSRDVEIDPRYLSDSNSLRFQLVGHYTTECEDPLHTSIWANISNKSQLDIWSQKLTIANDLALLPEPFFDNNVATRLTLPYVFAAHPEAATVHAAGVLSSWFGSKSGFRGARFPVILDQLPNQNAVIFAPNDHKPVGLNLEDVAGPTLRIVSNTKDPVIKYLVIQGKTADEIKTAVDGLVLGQAMLSGEQVTVGSVIYPKFRKLYDAPNWVPTDRPVKIGELVKTPEELQVKGRHPPPINLTVRVPADLMIWQKEYVPFDVKIRYTPPITNGNSVFAVSLNNSLVKSVYLDTSQDAEDKGIRLTIAESDTSKTDLLNIPAFEVGSDNQLSLQYMLGDYRQGWCYSGSVDSFLGAIDADSTLDFSKFHHYTALPNLSSYVNSGFPFTRYADLDQTTVILPTSPSTEDIEVYLSLLGNFGKYTGVPAYRIRVILGDNLSDSKDQDFLLIDTHASHPLLKQWKSTLPAVLEPSQRVFANNFRLAEVFEFRDLESIKKRWDEGGEATLMASGPLTLITGFESPLMASRSVVAFVSTDGGSALEALNSLEDGGFIRYIRGDVAVIRNKVVESFDLGNKYYTGHLPWWELVWFHLSTHPIVLGFIAVSSGIVLAFLIYALLKKVAQRRLRE